MRNLLIYTWFGPKCKCSIGRMIDFSHDFSYCFFFMYLLYICKNISGIQLYNKEYN